MSRARPGLALAALLALSLPLPPLTAAPRTWTDRDGRTVEAELVRADATSVVIRRVGDNREFTLPRDRLSPADLAHLGQLAGPADSAPGSAGVPPAPSSASAPQPPPPWIAALNAALGLPLFADSNLWDDAPAAVAARLGKLRPESITPGYESWRAYLRPPTPLLEVPAYMLALRAEEGRIAEISILFTNRGDYPAFAGRESWSIIPDDALKTFRDQLGRDFTKVRTRLAELLPKSDPASAPALRRAFPGELAVFVAGDHQLALQLLPDWHLALRIQPVERVSGSRLSDEGLRQRLRTKVTRRDTGDVVLNQIPMVDQGPKGYCVPATFERLLRYSGIAADLYDLAALGGTGFGGGTHVPKLVESLERTVRQSGRRLEPIEMKFTPAGLARYIDEGRPILWSLSSTPTFNALADAYTQQRAALTSPSRLKTWAADQRRLGETLAPDSESAHLCLLVGYNRATGELAFSDSWGPDFAERWLPASAIQAVSSGSCWALDF